MRFVNVAAGQLGPIARDDTRTQVVARLSNLMRQARSNGCDLIVYPELALTTFFPRWYMEDQSEIDRFFEREMPGPETQALFVLARELGIGFYLGYGELAVEDGVIHRYNSSILVDKSGAIVAKYRKVHLPGHAEHEPWREFQHLEKRYFEPGNRFGVVEAFGGAMGMAICNDRRWSETYRVMGLQGVEMVLIGYNTPVHNPPAPEHDDLSLFHNQLVMQAGAYQNGTWVVGVAKAGNRGGRRPNRRELHHRAVGRSRCSLHHKGRRDRAGALRPRSLQLLQAHHLQLRYSPAAPCLSNDCRAEGAKSLGRRNAGRIRQVMGLTRFK